MRRPQRRYHGTLSLTLLTFVTALLAAGVPGLIAHYQTRSLQQELGQAGQLGNALLGTASFAPALPGAVQASNQVQGTGAAVDSETAQLADSVPDGVGAETDQAWGEVSTRNVLGAQLGGHPAQFDLEYRSAGTPEYRMIAGTLPAQAPAEQKGAPTFDIAVSEQAAHQFGVKLGTVVHADNAVLVVTGIFQPEDTSSAYWAFDPALATPGGQPEVTPTGTILVGQVDALVGSGAVPEFTQIETPSKRGPAPESDSFAFCVPTDTSGYDAGNAGSISAALSGFTSGQTSTSLGLTLSAGSLNVLTPFQDERGTVDSILGLVLAGLATVSAAAVLLSARLVISRRRAHFALLRARGQSRRQLALQVFGGLAVPILPALAVALALARFTPWTGTLTTFAWTLFAGVALVAAVGPPLIAVFEHRGQATVQQDREDLVHRRPSTRRRLGELLLLFVCVGAIAALRQRGLGGSGGPNALGTAAPILMAAAATAIAVRCYPLVLRPAARTAAARGGPRSFFGLAAAARSPQAIAAPTFIIVLTLTLGALGVMMDSAVSAGRVTQSWLSNGADAVDGIGGNAETWAQGAAAVQQLQHVSGVTHAVVIYAQADSVASDGSDIAVDPGGYSAVTADSPWPFADALPEHPVPGPVPVVVSQSLGKPVGTTYTLTPTSGPQIPAKVVAVVPYTAAAPTGGDAGSATSVFTLLPAWAATQQYWPPTAILLSGTDIDRKAVAADVAGTLPGTTDQITYRQDMLAQLSAEPLQNLARFAYLIGVLAAACFGVCGILLALTLSAGPRNRRLSLLATLGLDPGQARGIALAETAPLAVAGVLGGLLSALALPAVFGSSLNLAAFTGLQTESGLAYDVTTPLLTALAAVVLTALGVAVQSWVAQRTSDVPAQLRIGDER